jgi:hypothetical protein
MFHFVVLIDGREVCWSQSFGGAIREVGMIDPDSDFTQVSIKRITS